MAATYTDNGTNTPNGSHLEFTYTFPVLLSTDVKVSLNNVIQATTKYTVSTSPAKITFNNTSVDSTVQESTGAPKTGVTVRIYRETDVGTPTGSEEPKANFASGSSVRASDLNNNFKQLLFAAHEKQNQPIVTHDLEDNTVTTAKMAFNSLDTLADQITANEPGWLTDIGIVAGDIGFAADMGSIADPSDSVTLGNINTVATSINAVNSYAQQYFIAAPNEISTKNPNPNEGDLWYDTTNNVMKYHNGSAYVEIGGPVTVVDEDNMASNSATVPPSQQSVKAYVDSLAWLDQTTKQDGSAIYWKDSSSKYFADNAQNIKLMDGGNF